jgi:hypothetical protein
MLKKLIFIVLLTLFTSACAQQAAFVSTPPGAQVFIDGEEIGMTPCTFNYNLSSTESRNVKINKPGYDPVEFVVVADEVDIKARNSWMAAGAVWSPLWLGTIFTKKLKDIYDFALLAEPPQMTASVEQTTAEPDL